MARGRRRSVRNERMVKITTWPGQNTESCQSNASGSRPGTLAIVLARWHVPLALPVAARQFRQLPLAMPVARPLAQRSTQPRIQAGIRPGIRPGTSGMLSATDVRLTPDALPRTFSPPPR